MRTVACYFYYFILLVLFASCQREPDETIIDQPAPVGTNDSIYLKTVITLDTSFASGIDTLDKYVFHYDGLKRLDFIDYYTYSPGITGFDHHSEKRFYTGNDTLPYKMSSVTDAGALFDTVFFGYQNGIIVYDSAIKNAYGFVTSEVRKFKSYGNGKFSQNLYSVYGGSLTLGDSVISVQTWQNGNIVTQLDTSFMASRDNTQKTIREFDNHVNPWRRLSLPYPIVTNAGYTSTYSLVQRTMSINNETKWQSDIDGLSAEDYSDNYEYRADGYPVLSRQTWYGNKYKVFYFYQELP